MSNLIWALLPIVIPAILYIFILTREGEFERVKNNLKRQDWITFFAVIFASTTLASSLRASGIQVMPWSSIFLACFIAIMIIVVVRRVRAGKPIIPLGWDERVQAIFAKSARNALFATYLALFLHLTITELDTLNANWLSIVIASGLFVMIMSMFFYYYRESL
jgi:membrane-associated HD superfamily phosphohydrolase